MHGDVVSSGAAGSLDAVAGCPVAVAAGAVPCDTSLELSSTDTARDALVIRRSPEEPRRAPQSRTGPVILSRVPVDR